MILKNTGLVRQNGTVLVLVALSLFLLMGIAALAIDMSHAEVNKTRLQNLADSLAISAAISLKHGKTTDVAQTEALLMTLPLIASASGNRELAKTAAASNFSFKFATDDIYGKSAAATPENLAATLNAWANPTTIVNSMEYRFVRVTMNTPMNVATWFAGIMGFNQMQVSASAVAGLAPGQTSAYKVLLYKDPFGGHS